MNAFWGNAIGVGIVLMMVVYVMPDGVLGLWRWVSTRVLRRAVQRPATELEAAQSVEAR